MFSLGLRHGRWQLTDGLKFCSCPWGTYSLNVKGKILLYTRCVSNDCMLVALIIKSIIAMERHFKGKLGERNKERMTYREWMGMNRDKWGDYY